MTAATDRIDGYLSRIAQRLDPAAIVVMSRVPEGTPMSSFDALSMFPTVWALRRPGLPDLALGTRVPSSYGDALDALHAWVRAEKAKKGQSK